MFLYSWNTLKVMYFVFFFLKQKTAYEVRISDWSADVCSSDLEAEPDRSFRPLLQSLYRRPRYSLGEYRLALHASRHASGATAAVAGRPGTHSQGDDGNAARLFSDVASAHLCQ